MMGIRERIEVWKNALFSPKATFQAEATTDRGLKDGIENIGTGLMVSYIPVLVVGFFLAGTIGAVEFIIGSVFTLALAVLMMIIVSAVFAGMMHLVAKLLGSKGTFSKLFYLCSIVYACLAVVLMPLALIGIIAGALKISFIEVIETGVSILAGLYALYMLTRAVESATQLSTIKSLASWMAPVVVGLVAAFAIFGTLLITMIRLLLMAV